jgi:UDP-glucose 6-dehydrogenase
VFIAVGTPTRRGDSHADLSYVYAAAEQVARALTSYAVPVDAGRRIAEIIRQVRHDLAFDVRDGPSIRSARRCVRSTPMAWTRQNRCCRPRSSIP